MKRLVKIALIVAVGCSLLFSGCGKKSSDTYTVDFSKPQESQTSSSITSASSSNTPQSELGSAAEQATIGGGSELEWYANTEHTVKASFDGVSTLTFSGDGEINPFNNDWILVDQSYAPWSDYAGQIKKIVVKEGITKIGFMSLSFLGYNVELELPASVEELGKPLTNYSTTLKSIKVDSDSEKLMVRDDALYCKNDAGMYEMVKYCTASEKESYSLPQDIAVSTIWRNAFDGALYLKKIDVALPAVSTIEKDAFSYCSALEELNLPDNLNVNLEEIAYGCDRLTTVTGGNQ